MIYHSGSLKEVYQQFGSSENGLSSRQAQKNLEKYGYNELKKEKKASKLKLFFSQFNSFIIYILLAATIISAVLGEWIDAAVIFMIIILNGVFGFIQENKAEKAIEALKRLASLKATVIRDGKTMKINSKDLVPGDVIILETGAKIPADARIIEAVNLKTLESSLTGESVPVRKENKVMKVKTQLADRINMVFSGTVVTNGRGRAVVTGTGMDTQIGKIAGLIQSAKTEMTPLQKKLKSLGKMLGILVIIICFIVFGVGVLRGGEILEMFLASVSLAVAAIPEGLPAVITISLAIGVQKMVGKHALMRKLPSVETLGSTTIICTDKTGTLTKNEMTVRKVFVDNKIIKISGTGYIPEGKLSENPKNNLVFEIGALCNDAKLFFEKHRWDVSGDPTEACLITAAKKAGVKTDYLINKHPRIDEIQFDSKRKRMTTMHKFGNKKLAYVKGGPDVLLGLCTKIIINNKIRKITAADKKRILKINEEFSSEALRVLAFAYRDVTRLGSLKDHKKIEKDLIFVGLQGMIDPPRHEVRNAISKCRTAGIRVVMITGDYKGTAMAIAKELGIEGRAVEGSELDKINLEKEIDSIGICARVNPEHKMKIVNVLQAKGHVVAMTGDGVNDAPALKSADLGIAMGITGTDVAKEASAMILTDDNFSSIVEAVEEGRGIDDNIKKFVNYLLSSNMGEVLVIFIAMLIGFQFGGKIIIPLTAVQILWMNLVTDGLPALALGVDPIAKGIMQRPPRKSNAHIISKNMVWSIFLTGAMLCFFTLILFHKGLSSGPAKAQTMAFSALVVFQIIRVYMVRSQYKTGLFSNRWLWGAIAVSLMLQFFAVYVNPINMFGTVALSITDWGYIVGSGVLMLAIGTIFSPIIRKATHEMD